MESLTPHMQKRELNVQQWTDSEWVPGLSVGSKRGWKSRSRQRGTVWAEEANVAHSAERGQVDRIADPREIGYVALAGEYRTWESTLGREWSKTVHPKTRELKTVF